MNKSEEQVEAGARLCENVDLVSRLLGQLQAADEGERRLREALEEIARNWCTCEAVRIAKQALSAPPAEAPPRVTEADFEAIRKINQEAEKSRAEDKALRVELGLEPLAVAEPGLDWSLPPSTQELAAVLPTAREQIDALKVERDALAAQLEEAKRSHEEMITECDRQTAEMVAERDSLRKQLEDDEPESGEKWRVGRSVGRTLYLDNKLVGLMDTPELAAQVVDALNAKEKP